MNGDEYITGTGQRIVMVHQPYQCNGPWCVIHNPAPGPWSDWPTHWLSSPLAGRASGIMTRRCPHDFLHPCVEDIVMHADAIGDHGCDGCPCGPEHIGSRSALPPSLSSAPPNHVLIPPDYDGQPARLTTDLSLAEQFAADQNEAGAEEALSAFVSYLVGLVIQNGGNHPGRSAVPAEWLAHMSELHPTQVKALAQFACWTIAEGMLMGMQHRGELRNRFGIELGKGFTDDGK